MIGLLGEDLSQLHDAAACGLTAEYGCYAHEGHRLMSTPAQTLIDAELAHAKDRGATLEDDSKQTLGDFLVYAKVHLDRAFQVYSGFPIATQHELAKAEFVKVGALVHSFFNSRQ